MKSTAADKQATKLRGRSRGASRAGNRSPVRYSRIQLVNFAKVATNAVASALVVPLGQTPNYLDPQSQEALHEVDVSGTALNFTFDQAPEGEAIGSVR